MKKTMKIAGLLAGVALAVPAVATYKQYHKMKKIEEKLDALPMHKVKENLSRVHQEEDQIVVQIPKKTSFLDRLTICASILNK